LAVICRVTTPDKLGRELERGSFADGIEIGTAFKGSATLVFNKYGSAVQLCTSI